MPSVAVDLGIFALLVVFLIRKGRADRAAAPKNPSPQWRRGEKVGNAGLVTVTVGILFAFTYMVSDPNPVWLHRLSLPAAVAFIVAGFVLSFVAGWIRDRGPRGEDPSETPHGTA